MSNRGKSSEGYKNIVKNAIINGNSALSENSDVKTG